MKTWIIPAIAMSLLLASPAAFAAPPDQNGTAQQDQHKGKHTNAGGNQGGQNDANASGNTNAGNNHTNNINQNTNVNHNVNINKNTNVDRNVTVDRNINKNTNVNRNVNINRNVGVNRTVRINRHIDVRVYQRNLYSPHRYHWQTYRQPTGWYHHRWGYGQHLPRAWFARDYWIPNFIMFGLIAPPGGYVWVRVGEDALLIDPETGEVIRVVYGVFY